MQASFHDTAAFAVCPRCRSALALDAAGCACTSAACGSRYPVVRGTPVLIADERSVFRLADYREDDAISLGYTPRRSLVAALMGWVPSLTENRVGTRMYDELLRRIRRQDRPRQSGLRVLVIGAGDAGEGIAALRAAPDVLLVETDVYFVGTVAAIADGHDLPFADASFDAVVVQAVLEHVVDPWRCVAETHRVLRPGGLVYAETPFMYPVHLGAYDFHRFSLLGHRRLFRHFAEVESGVIAGAGTALAVATRSFFLTLWSARIYQGLVRLIVPFFVFWLKYVDRLTSARRTTADFASTTYFLGSKSETALSDAELLAGYPRAA